MHARDTSRCFRRLVQFAGLLDSVKGLRPPSAVLRTLDRVSAARRRRVASQRARRKERTTMLRIYAVILDTIRYVRPTIETIEKKDSDLGRQMRRAAASIALNA